MKMAMLSGAVLAAALGMGMPATAAAGQAGTAGLRSGIPADFVAAVAADLDHQRQVRMTMAPVRSRAQLAEYLARTPAAASPLSRLSPHARDRFVASLVFNENGLASFRYRDLEDELSASEAYRVLALFGAEDLVPRFSHLRVETPADRMVMDGANSPVTLRMFNDHLDYWCVARATCERNSSYICMSGC